MTRRTRRPPRVQPPLRGRSAAFSGSNQSCLAPLTVYRQGPPRGGPIREKGVGRDNSGDIHPVLIKLHQLSPSLAALAALLFLAVIFGTLL